MPEVGPLPEPLNSSPVDFSKHWSILDQTKAEFKALGRSGVIIIIEDDDPYRDKLSAWLAKYKIKKDMNEPHMKRHLVIEHATLAEGLFNELIAEGLHAELILAE